MKQVEIERLKEIPTQWYEMVEYLEGEKIVRPQYQKKYKTKQEVKAFNDGIQKAIQMIGSVPTKLVDTKEEQAEGIHTINTEFLVNSIDEEHCPTCGASR